MPVPFFAAGAAAARLAAPLAGVGARLAAPLSRAAAPLARAHGGAAAAAGKAALGLGAYTAGAVGLAGAGRALYNASQGAGIPRSPVTGATRAIGNMIPPSPVTSAIQSLGRRIEARPHMGPAFGGDQQNFPDGRGQVGGGNAGASVAGPRRTTSPAPAAAPVSSGGGGGWTSAAQGNPRLPGGRNVAIVNPRHRAQNRALDIAAQNAGLPAWNWQAEENAAMLQAAETRGQAAVAARESQGGRGYITADNLPAALDQSKAEYWQAADKQAWAAANPELAKRAMAQAGYNPQQDTLAGMAAAAAQSPASGPGASRGAEWSFAKPAGELTGQMARSAATIPGYDASAMAGPDFQAPPQAATGWQVRELSMPASGPGASVGADWSFAKPSGPVTQPLAAAAAAAPGYDINAMSKPDFMSLPASAPAQTMPLTQDQQFPLTPGSVLPGGGPVIDDEAQARLQGYLQRIKNLNPTEWNFNRRAG